VPPKLSRRAFGQQLRRALNRSSPDNCVKFLVDERLHGLGADVSLRGQLAEAAQDFLFRVRAQDQDAIVPPQGPILAFDFHTGLCGDFIEGVSPISGFFEGFRTLFGESKQADVSDHNMSFFFLVVSLPFLAPSCDATNALKPNELNQTTSRQEGADNKHSIRHRFSGKRPGGTNRSCLLPTSLLAGGEGVQSIERCTPPRDDSGQMQLAI
jgi:hypothetical protein